jgi:anti-sigma regulatory factor (Ser/Thr protein kinase)
MLNTVRPAGFDPTVDETIACSPRAPGVARHAVQRLADAVDPSVLRNAQLLVSEVVTNSIKHSGSDDPIQLRVWTRPGGLKVEVADGGFGFNARPPAHAGDDEGGRGLLILESLADRWGTSCDIRARVWFELSPRPVSRGARAD